MNDASAKTVDTLSLPRGWAQGKLGDILPLQYGKGLVAKYRKSAGNVPVYGSSGIVGTHDEALTSGPAIIVGRKGSVGSVFLSRSACWPIDTVYYTQPASFLDLSFFSYLLSHLNLSRLDRSTAVPGLTREDYNALEVAIPPLGEQERIVAKIDELFSELDAGAASLKRARALLKKYRQAVLKAAVTGELTRDWRERHGAHINESGADLLQRILKARRQAWEAAALKKQRAKGKPPKDDRWKQKYKEPQPPDTSGLPALPESWVWARVEQLGMVTGGLTKNPKRSSLTLKVPYLRVANVYADELRLDVVEEIGIASGELDRVLLEPYDLLVVEGNGSVEQIGRVAIWDGSIDRCAHQNHLIKVRFVEKKLAEFAGCWLLSSSGRRMVEQVASSTSGLHTLSISKVEALCVPVPPLSELEHALDEVEAALSNFQNTEAAISIEMQRAAAVRQSILKVAFAGKLVPQDPNDEPASVLLERIRAERAAKPKPARGRRGGRRQRNDDQVDLALDRGDVV